MKNRNLDYISSQAIIDFERSIRDSFSFNNSEKAHILVLFEEVKRAMLWKDDDVSPGTVDTSK